MKKSDLKTGMWIEQRDGHRLLVLLDTNKGDVCSGKEDWYPLNTLTENLTNKTDKKFDIIRVLQPLNNSSYYSCNSYDIIWERDNTKEMTIEEIQKELGYKIKIVE